MPATTKEIIQYLKNGHFYWKVGFLGIASAGLIHLLFLVLFLIFRLPLMAAVNLISVGIYWYSLYGLGLEAIRKNDDRLIGWLIYGELIGHNLLATWYLGREANFHYYLYLPALLPFFITTYPRVVYLVRISLVIVLSLWIEISPLFDAPKVPVSPFAMEIFHLTNLLIFLGILSMLAYLYTTQEQLHHDEIRKKTHEDPLTGLYNRRYVNDLLENAQFDPKYWPSPGLILIDIDRFKSINDTRGHLCGDQLIVAVARTLKAKAPARATVARWGGDEYLILLNDTDLETLKKFTTKLHTGISRQRFRCNNDSLHVTLTVGATLFHKDETFENMLQRADKALYHGKELGRDQAIIF